MRDPAAELSERFRNAIERAFGAEHAAVDPAVRRSEHGDYQANVAMGLAKALRKNPRTVAQELIDALDVSGLCGAPVIAGPGFINLKLSDEFITANLTTALGDARLGVPKSKGPETVVVDYSSPNTSKEMHVGHLRSTIIGDSLARTLEFVGHRVVRQNHIGDWGTPFGMLIEHLLDLGEGASAEGVKDLNEFYRQARKKFEDDPGFADRSRRRVVLLQSGDPATLELWRSLVAESRRYIADIYRRLDVTLRDEDVRGESFYNPVLSVVASELQQKGLAIESEGALCVFVPGFTNREGDPLPLIVRKQDGGFGYAATDLAALRYRVRDIGATRLLYVVGSPQTQHFSMLFEAGKLAGWLDGVRAEHVAFGSMLGADNKMYKTRSGETVRLVDLVDEAVERALRAVQEKNPGLDEETRARVAREVGIGAMKYADLSSDRIKDYVFDWDRMLAFEGNTGPYLMYAHARIYSILRRAESEGIRRDTGSVRAEHPAERALAVELMGLPGVLAVVADTLQPHRLCAYLFDLATAFTAFYESCPVLRADTDERRSSRLAFCELTAGALRVGLGLLGITAPERM